MTNGGGHHRGDTSTTKQRRQRAQTGMEIINQRPTADRNSGVTILKDTKDFEVYKASAPKPSLAPSTRLRYR